ncbi:ABC transporter [Microtetraspora malaysiensis]|uniref:ABC transporter n=1 Tax=Microtetraspora malaysiensis TaxID=161358 RepID=UPI003D8D89C6
MTRNPAACGALAVLSAATLLAGCARTGAGENGHEVATQKPAALPHGYVEGAEESAEPHPRLVIADSGTGTAHLLDLVSGEVTSVGAAGGAGVIGSVGGDGRFTYLSTRNGTATRVIDGGTWTVDHGDHSHYYRAEARDVGTLTGGRPRSVLGDVGVTVVSFSDGTAKVLDRAALEKGDLVEIALIDTGGHGAIVPYGEHLLVTGAGPAGKDTGGVDVRTRDGRPADRIGTPCPEPHGAAVTRRGAVIGCADGALLVTVKDGEFTGEKIRYPGKPPKGDRALEFHHRPGSTTLAARAGDAGIWVLDVAARKWRLLKTGPAVAVTATGDDAPVLSLTADGVLHAYDTSSGDETATTELLAAPLPRSGAAPAIQADRSRAYVSDPAGKAVHEIDYNDDLRRARTFELGFPPAAMVETGR